MGLSLARLDFSSPSDWGEACHFLGVPLEMLAAEMHISTTWKGLGYLIKWLFEILPVLDHQWNT